MSACRLLGSRKIVHNLLKNNIHTGFISKVSYIYDVTVSTGDSFGAGTDANVYIRLIGEKGSTDEIQLKTTKNDMERGMVNSYKVSADEDVGELKKVIMKHDNTGFAPAWLLEKIEIFDNRGRNYKFDCHTWLVKDGATNPIVLLKTDTPTMQRVWEKRQNEIPLDEGLKQVVQSIIGIDDIFQETMYEKEEILEDLEDDEPSIETPSEISLSARHASSLSPAVRFLVDTYGVDFFKIDGTGRNGRVLKSDVIRYMSAYNITEKCPTPGEPVTKVDPIPEKISEVIIEVMETQKHVTEPPTVTPSPLSFTDSSLSESDITRAAHVTNNKYQSPHLYMNSRCVSTNMVACVATMEADYKEYSLSLLVCHGVVKALTDLVKIQSISLETIDIVLSDHGGMRMLLRSLHERSLQDVFDGNTGVNQDSIQDESLSNVSVNIVKADGVIQLSPVLSPGQILNVTYNDYLPILDPDTKAFVPTCVVTITCDGRYVSEEIAALILDSMKKFVEQPVNLML